MPHPATDRPEPKEFAAFLLEQASGKTHDELTDGLRDLVNKVTDTGKKGSLTLIVTVEPMKNDETILVVSDEIRLKLPEHDRKASIFWADKDGSLLRNDPNQRSIFDPPEPVEPIRADPVTGEVIE